MRYFFATELEGPLRPFVYEVMARLKKAYPSQNIRWQDLHKLHLTLQFLGEINFSQLAHLQQAISKLSQSFTSFNLTPSRVELFPGPERPWFIVLGFAACPKLLQLVAGIRALACGANIPLSARPFRPHLTLGRAKKQRLTGIDDIIIPKELFLPIKRIELFESQFRAGSSIYRLDTQVILPEPYYAC